MFLRKELKFPGKLSSLAISETHSRELTLQGTMYSRAKKFELLFDLGKCPFQVVTEAGGRLIRRGLGVGAPQ